MKKLTLQEQNDLTAKQHALEWLDSIENDLSIYHKQIFSDIVIYGENKVSKETL